VSTSGDDADAGTSQAAAWRTLQHAVDQAAPGDTILVLPGAYPGARIEKSGTAGAPITLRAKDAATVTLNAPGASNSHDSIVEMETWEGTGIVAHWVIQGFEISGASRYGVDVRSGRHVVIKGNRVHHSGLTGIFTAFTSDVTIADNESHDNGEHGIYHSNSGDRAVIRGNTLHNNHACGIHMNGDLSMGGDGTISDCVVEANIIHENGVGGGSAINMDGVVQSIVRNNLVYKNHSSGISLYQIDGAVCSNHNRVLHNTIVVPDDGRWAVNIPGSGCTHNEVFNNILYNGHSWRGSISISQSNRTGFSSDYNAVVNRFTTDDGDTTISLSQWQSLGYDTHSFTAEPADLFVNPTGDDYHPKTGSPAIDAGTVLPDVTKDLEGQPRPQGSGPDLGAYELKASTSESPKEFLAIAPVPDLNGSGSEEFALLLRNTETNVCFVEVKDGATGKRISQIRFVGAGYQPVALAALADMDGNAASELAVLHVHKDNGKVAVHVRDGLSGQPVSTVPFGGATTCTPKDLTVMQDMNGNGSPELAVLCVNGRKTTTELVVKDALTGQLLKRITLK
jgi:parallel beta-helix repeat protein